MADAPICGWLITVFARREFASEAAFAFNRSIIEWHAEKILNFEDCEVGTPFLDDLAKDSVIDTAVVQRFCRDGDALSFELIGFANGLHDAVVRHIKSDNFFGISLLRVGTLCEEQQVSAIDSLRLALSNPPMYSSDVLHGMKLTMLRLPTYRSPLISIGTAFSTTNLSPELTYKLLFGLGSVVPQSLLLVHKTSWLASQALSRSVTERLSQVIEDASVLVSLTGPSGAEPDEFVKCLQDCVAYEVNLVEAIHLGLRLVVEMEYIKAQINHGELRRNVPELYGFASRHSEALIVAVKTQVSKVRLTRRSIQAAYRAAQMYHSNAAARRQELLESHTRNVENIFAAVGVGIGAAEIFSAEWAAAAAEVVVPEVGVPLSEHVVASIRIAASTIVAILAFVFLLLVRKRK